MERRLEQPAGLTNWGALHAGLLLLPLPCQRYCISLLYPVGQSLLSLCRTLILWRWPHFDLWLVRIVLLLLCRRLGENAVTGALAPVAVGFGAQHLLVGDGGDNIQFRQSLVEEAVRLGDTDDYFGWYCHRRRRFLSPIVVTGGCVAEVFIFYFFGPSFFAVHLVRGR